MTPMRDAKYLAAIRLLPCCLAGHGPCDGPIEAHHAFKARAGGGMGLKGSDYSAVPLCHGHHQAVHGRGVPMLWGVVLAGAVVALAGQELARRVDDSADSCARTDAALALGGAVELVIEALEQLRGGGR